MKYLNIILLTTAFSMNAGFAAEASNNMPETCEHKSFRYKGEGNSCFANKDFDTATQNYSAALALPELTEVNIANFLYHLAFDYSKKGNFADAIIQYTAALDMRGLVGAKRAGCLYALGIAHLEQGNFADAIAQFNTAKDMPELSDKKYNCLALMCLAKQKLNLSTNVTEKPEKDAVALLNLGIVNLKQGKIELGITHLTEALNTQRLVGEIKAKCYYALGNAYLGQKEFVYAKDIFKEALNMPGLSEKYRKTFEELLQRLR